MIFLYQKEIILKESSKNFKEKIKEEMVVDYANALEKNYGIAKNLLRLTSAGKVDIKDKERLDEKDKILLYMIGKLYAKEAELAESEYVSNKEFANELGMNENSIRSYLSQLKTKTDKKKDGGKAFHRISINYVEKILKKIDKKFPK